MNVAYHRLLSILQLMNGRVRMVKIGALERCLEPFDLQYILFQTCYKLLQLNSFMKSSEEIALVRRTLIWKLMRGL